MIPEALIPSGTAAPELLELELADAAAVGSPSQTPEAPGTAEIPESAETAETSRPRGTVTPSAEAAVPEVDASEDGASGVDVDCAGCAGADPPEGCLPSATFSGEIPREDGTLFEDTTPSADITASAEKTAAEATSGAEATSEPVATPDPFSDNTDAGPLPGSTGEHLLQAAYGTEKRAKRFYDDQVLDHLNERMREFVERMDMAFIASSDEHGECDASFRAGPPGFIEVLDDRHIAYPEYRGNGVMASLGNISENPHVGILLIDFVTDLIGLHINGRARIVEDSDLRAAHPELPADFDRARKPERWVVVDVVECYIHCRKHIPRMVPVLRQRSWGTDDVKRKGGDFFEAKNTPRSWQPEQVSSGSN